MSFRHEVKHEITYADFLCLRSRLSHVMETDSHAENGSYFVRSMYFDDIYDTALKQKINGVNRRQKFRLRYYDNNTGYIVLESKSKINNLCLKRQARIDMDIAKDIISGSLKGIEKSTDPVLNEFVGAITMKNLRPKTIVDYRREPYVYYPGNVRVTLDYNIRTGLNSREFFDSKCITVPVKGNPIILEVKWDEYLPNIIRDIVLLQGINSGAFSKYAASRIYD